MATLKESAESPSSGLTVEILLRGVLTLEQGQAKKVFKSLQDGLENLVAQNLIPTFVAKQFRQLRAKILKKKEEEMEVKKMETVKVPAGNVLIIPPGFYTENCHLGCYLFKSAGENVFKNYFERGSLLEEGKEKLIAMPVDDHGSTKHVPTRVRNEGGKAVVTSLKFWPGLEHLTSKKP